MMLPRWLRSLRCSLSQPSTPRRRHLRLLLEELENRTLPSANFGGVVTPQGTSPSTGAAVATDAAGNVYYAGTFDGIAAFGATSLTSAGGDDAYVAKVDPIGNYLWAVRLGGAGNDSVAGVAVDQAGNPYLVGYLNGYALTKLNGGDGSRAWTTSLSYQPGGIALDKFGYIYVVGRTPISGSQLFVSAFASTGAPRWADKIGNSQSTFSSRLAITADGGWDVWVTGGFTGNNVRFGSASGGRANLSSAGRGSAFVLLLSGANVFEWVGAFQPTTSTSFVEGTSIAVTNLGGGAYYVAGDFSGSVNFNPAGTPSYVLTSGATSSSFVARLNVGPKLAWARSFGGNNSAATSLALDGLGNLYVSGYFQSVATIGGTTLTSAGANDAYAARLDSNGNFQWAAGGGGSGDDRATGIAVDKSGNVYVNGSLDLNPLASSYSAVFGPDPGTEVITSWASAFLWKLSQS